MSSLDRGVTWRVHPMVADILRDVCDQFDCSQMTASLILYSTRRVRGRHKRNTWDIDYKRIIRERQAKTEAKKLLSKLSG